MLDHDSVSWRCIKCITHKQAENIRQVASDHKTTVHDFLTVPVGEHGPPEECVDTFVEYLEALHLEDKKRTASLLKKLNKYKAEEGKKPKKTKSKAKKRKAEDVDCHHLDEQIKEDIEMIKLFTVGDLRALLEHHNLPSSGTKPFLVERLEEYYNKKE